MSDASIQDEPVYTNTRCTRCHERLTVEEKELHGDMCDYCEHMTSKDD
jgi:DNA-directed RNA polymerase subunit RPC12/RpoP